MFPGIKSYRGYSPVVICRCPDRPAERPHHQALRQDGAAPTWTSPRITADRAISGWGWSTRRWLKLTRPHRPPGHSGIRPTDTDSTCAQPAPGPRWSSRRSPRWMSWPPPSALRSTPASSRGISSRVGLGGTSADARAADDGGARWQVGVKPAEETGPGPPGSASRPRPGTLTRSTSWGTPRRGWRGRAGQGR